MKKMALIVALALVAGGLFAQPGMMGGGRGGPGMGQDIDWKIGTVVTTEYKKLTGTVSIGQTLSPTFKADGVEYQIWFPRSSELSTLKNGDTITVEGTFTSVKSDTKVPAVAHPFKLTLNGKEIDLTADQGNDPFGQGNGPMGGRGKGPRN